MQVLRFLLILISTFLSACTSWHGTQDYQMGKLDFLRGDFKQAFHRLLPVAYAGKPQAQYAIGYMYYYGYGVALDEESGIFWMSRAADRHYPLAMDALFLIHHRQSLFPCPKKTIIRSIHDFKGELIPSVNNNKKTFPKEQSILTHKMAEVVPAEKKYTLQLYGSYNLNSVNALKEKLNLENLFAAKTKHNNRDWYVLVYGKYSAPYLAALAKDDIPAKLTLFNPWVRKMDSLKEIV